MTPILNKNAQFEQGVKDMGYEQAYQWYANQFKAAWAI